MEIFIIFLIGVAELGHQVGLTSYSLVVEVLVITCWNILPSIHCSLPHSREGHSPSTVPKPLLSTVLTSLPSMFPLVLAKLNSSSVSELSVFHGISCLSPLLGMPSPLLSWQPHHLGEAPCSPTDECAFLLLALVRTLLRGFPCSRRVYGYFCMSWSS